MIAECPKNNLVSVSTKNFITFSISPNILLHFPTNANKKKWVKERVAPSTQSYLEKLNEAVALDREGHGKKP